MENDKLTVEPCDEFEKLLPRLSAESYEALRESIEFAGVRESILVWKDKPGHAYIVDGYNRCRIAEHEGITSTLQYSPVISIKSKDDAIEWIINNQLMRRNLTDAQRIIFVGMAAARKAAKGKVKRTECATQEKNKSGDISQNIRKGQIDPLGTVCKKRTLRSRNEVAKELGSTPGKVKNAMAVQRKLSALDVAEPKVADRIRDDVRTGIIASGSQLKKALQRTTQSTTTIKSVKPKPDHKDVVEILLGDVRKDFMSIMLLRDRHLGVQADAEALDALIAARILSYWNDRGIEFMAFRNLEVKSTKGKK